MRRFLMLGVGVFLLLSLVLGISSVQARGGHPTRTPSKGVLSGPLTTAKIKAYVTTHQFMGGPVVGGGYPTVVTIQEMTVQQVSTLLRDALIEPNPNALVFYVALHGPFVMEGMSLPPGQSIPTVNTVFEVFDARTGNVPVWGIAG